MSKKHLGFEKLADAVLAVYLVIQRHRRGKVDLDAEVLPDEGEESGGEVDPPFPVQGHVHPDQLLVG